MSTVAELRKVATDLKIAGRSKMVKAELEAAIAVALDSLHDEANLINDTKMIVASVASPRISGQPLSAMVRAEHYKRQNGADRLTAKQARRLAKKIFRNRNWQLANI